MTAQSAMSARRRALALTISSLLCARSPAAPPALPVPCAAGSCPTGPGKWVTAGAATAVSTANNLTVNQTSNSAILNWASFNIGAQGSVTFAQPNSSSIALNRIFQANPSQIFGSLKANGQVYLVNMNGFVFGGTSTVNVGGLLVSSLPLALSDADFAKGILSPLQDNKPVLDAFADPLAPGVGRASVLDANGFPVLDSAGKPLAVQIAVLPGASLSAASGGRLLLAGQSVSNAGALSAPDGQIVLAAGQRVYLQADSDPALRGLVVEVDQGGSAWNQLTGSLSAARGNVSMVGMMVNQDGRISATTSVAANGSVRLEAADTAAFNGTSTKTVSATHGGSLTLGAASEIDVLPELDSSATEVAAQTQYPSSIALLGEQVILKGGASITAPNGKLTAIAALDPSAGVSAGDGNARLRIDSGVNIDLSGSSTTLPMSANLVSAQLRSNELANDPSQRDGALRGQTVYVDARNAPPKGLADVTGEIQAIPQTVAQRTEAGGTAQLESEGDVVFAPGARINVSGGATTYLGGVLQTSYLIGANGQLYPIATADPLQSYVGVLNPNFSETFDKWGVKDVLPSPGLSAYQPGYVQGAPAGTVQFVGPALVLQGSLLGNASNGLYQRTPSTAVSGGQLIIGVPGGVGNSVTVPPIDFFAPGVTFTSHPTPVVVADDVSLPGSQTLQLPLNYLTNSGFTSTKIYSDFGVTLPGNTPLTLPSGSTLSVTAARVEIDSGISDAGGSLSFQTADTLGNELPQGSSPRPGIYLGDNVQLDVRGRWTNDALAANTTQSPPTAGSWQNGGSITLTTTALSNGLLSIGNNDALLLDGGAWLKANNSWVYGSGGKLAINANAIQGGGLVLGNDVRIEGFGTQGASGGSFSLSAPRIEITSGASSWAAPQSLDESLQPDGVLSLDTSLFSQYGFQNFSLSATANVRLPASTQNVLTLDAGSAIDAKVMTQGLDPRAAFQASAANVGAITAPTLLPQNLRSGASVSLSSLPSTAAINSAAAGTSAGDILIGEGASISTDPFGSIALASLDSIVVDGALRAPGGSVSLQILSPLVNNQAYATYDVGYLPDQRIELGSSGSIDVSGSVVTRPSATGLSLGSASAGGSVRLLADRGAIYADPGSLIAASGTTASLDVAQPSGGYVREALATAGGTVTLRSGEAIALLGDLREAAGPTGTTGPAPNGELDVALTRSESFWSVSTPALSDTFSSYPLTVELLANAGGLNAPSSNNNQAVLGAAQLKQWGVGALRLEAGDAVEIAGNVNLSLDRELSLNSPLIIATGGTQAAFSAPYLEVGNSLGLPNTHTSAPGSGQLSFSGSEVDLYGSTVIQGASNVQFTSQGDLLLRGSPTGSGLTLQQGALSLQGTLGLNAARIYPVTATSFTLNISGSPQAQLPGSVLIGQTGSSAGIPYSAGGSLTINADQITSNGSLYAPFGTLTLNGAQSLTLGDHSVTSVSGAGLTIPYGATQFNGTQWQYDSGFGPSLISATPTRQVNLTSPAVTLAKEATIDVSGGGDLSAYEWVPGPGGSIDALANGATSGLFAILPSTRGLAAPQDPAFALGSTVAAGSSIYISAGTSQLAPGYYPLLPARYALEPGAVLVQAESRYQSAAPGVLGALSDGTPVVAGFLSYESSGLHQTPGYTGFAIYPGSYGSQLAGYTQSTASSYFAAQAASAGTPRPVLPADAGALAINVTTGPLGSLSQLNLDGLVRTAAGAGGQAATVAVSAEDLIVGSLPSAPPGSVSVSDSTLTGWQAGTLLLGGAPAAADGSRIEVNARSVTLASGSSLSAGQVVVVAGQSIEVASGATVQSNPGEGSPPPLQSVALTGANGEGAALLAVSNSHWIVPTRDPSSGSGASLTLESGSVVSSTGALTLDAPASLRLNGTLSGAGAEWSLGASSIAVTGGDSSLDALTISPALVAQLNGARAVRLSSSGSIALLTPLNLGGLDAKGRPTLDSLTLQASELDNGLAAGAPGDGTVQLTAQKISLAGVNVAAAAPGTLSAGELSLTANELDVGPGSFAVNGFSRTRANIQGPMIGQGSGKLVFGGDLAISASEVTVASGADTHISATGTMTVEPGSGASPHAVGGALSLAANNMVIDGTISAPSGWVRLDAATNMTVGSSGEVSAAGTLLPVGNQIAATPGGWVNLTAGGNLNGAAGSVLDVSGPKRGGDLSLTALGSADIQSTLHGGAGGSFALDAGQLVNASGVNPLDAIATELSSSGFTHGIAIRARQGDLSLGAGSEISANQVSLTADAGTVGIAGVVLAPAAAQRGRIELFGGNGVELFSGGELHADASSSAGRGGEILIGAGHLQADGAGFLDAYNNAQINLDAGSVISASGSQGGSLTLRAPAVQVNGLPSLQIGNLAADLHGFGALSLEPVLVFNTANPTGPVVFSDAAAPSAQDWGNLQQYLANYESTLPALSNQFAALNVPLLLQPAIEIVAPGDFSINSNLDLSGWHPANMPLDLSVRAAGNLSVNATVSDGFVSNTVGNQSQITLAPGLSSSMRLVAGADVSSADPTAVKLGSGNLTFAAQSVARTGTGDVTLAAGGDIVLAGSGSGAFTAGTAGVAAGGSVADPYAGVPAPLGVDLLYGVAVPGTAGQSDLLMSFPSQGGNLSVRAGGNIINTATSAASAVSSWELREGGGKTKTPLPNGTTLVPASWGINLAAYDWNFGTLGGGDVSVSAGGNALNVSIAAADALLPPNGAPQQLLRSGSLDVRVGNDMGSAQLFQADGSGTVRVNGALTAILPALQAEDPAVGTALYLQSGSLSVSARTGMAVDGIFNPTGLGQVPNNTSIPLPGVLSRSYLSYGDTSALNLESTTGDITLGTAVSASPTLLGSKTSNLSGIVNNASGDVLPPEFTVQATSGSIAFGQGLGGAGVVTLAPSSQGQLVLLAGQNISNPTGNARLTMSDATPGSYPSVQALGGTSLVESQTFNANLHSNDPLPVLISAGGDISQLNLSLPKAAQIVAGRDLIDVTYAGENLHAGDVTLLSAGRDLGYSSGYGGGNGISVGGPGQLDLLAGRNISLGFSLGVISSGNLFNANLPTATGADITMVSGLKSTPDVNAFLGKIVAPSKDYQAQLVNYVEGLAGSGNLSYSQAQASFESLSPTAQWPLLDAIFFNELLLSGRAANSVPGAGFAEGYAAIDALFPGSRAAAPNALPGAFGGDLRLDFSRIYTLSGGNITLVVPGGGLDVGLANPPDILGNRLPSTLGIVAEGAGNVDIFTKTDVNVNASRIFTLGGGNIEIWSDEGSIDAGRGAKTAVSAPPPTVLINSDGTVSLNFSGAAAGSGIRTIQTDPATPPGNVDLIAPVGSVNAGDAGIGSAGNINIAARTVVGLDNINFGGTASGVPAQVSNIGAALSGASSAASASSNSATGAVSSRSAETEAAAPLAAGALSWLDVFVTGLGEENCPPSDIECLKRQKTPNH